MEKELRKICAGLVRARDRTWFTELSDKDMLFLEIFTISLFSKKHQSALVLVHEELWWQLCAMIMNISKHFQGWTVSNWMGQLSQSGTLVIIIMQDPNRQFGQGDCPGEIEGVYAWGKVAMATKQLYKLPGEAVSSGSSEQQHYSGHDVTTTSTGEANMLPIVVSASESAAVFDIPGAATVEIAMEAVADITAEEYDSISTVTAEESSMQSESECISGHDAISDIIAQLKEKFKCLVNRSEKVPTIQTLCTSISKMAQEKLPHRSGEVAGQVSKFITTLSLNGNVTICDQNFIDAAPH
ncbi:hypothetical protein EMCRGX_G002893 [Ephydatia muelleri]